LPRKDSTIFCGSWQSGIARSQDNGATWKTIDSGLTDLDVRCIFIDGATVLAGSSSGIFRSTDNGDTWVEASIGLLPMAAHDFLKFGTAIFAACSNSVLRSNDGGASWIVVDLGLTGHQPMCLAAGGGALFVGLSGDGVLCSTDAGSTWKPFTEGLTLPFVWSMSASNDQLFIGNWPGGVWRRPLSDALLAVQHEENETVASFTISPNYPNPFSDRTAMQYKLTRSGFVSVRVCDLFGRTVKILLAEVQPSGIHTLSWNARDGAGNRVAPEAIS